MKVAFLVACFIGVAVNAAVPGENDAPGVCVYPTLKDYRCNGNEILSAAEEAAIIAEVRAQEEELKEWIKAGDVDSLLATFTEDIKYIYGGITMNGHDQLRPFMTYMMANAGDKVMTRTNMIHRVLNRRHVILVNGEFSFPDGFHGRYLCGVYFKQNDGKWKNTFINIQPAS